MERDFPLSDDFRPLGYVGKVPLTLTNLVLLVNGMFLFALIGMAGSNAELIKHVSGALRLDAAAVVDKLEFYRILSYPLGESATGIMWSIVSMLVFYFAGREVERYIGRRGFTLLLLTTWMVPAGFLLGLYPFEPTAAYGGSAVFYSAIIFGATLIHPTSEPIMRIEARWLGLGLVCTSLAMAFFTQQWTLLLMLTVSYLTCFMVLRKLGVLFTYFTAAPGQRGLVPPRDYLAANQFLHERRREHKYEDLMPPVYEEVGARKPRRLVTQEAEAEAEPEDVHECINPVLDKIADQGMGSLTDTERATLERARKRLMELDKH